jgi:hypothetical protein
VVRQVPCTTAYEGEGLVNWSMVLPRTKMARILTAGVLVAPAIALLVLLAMSGPVSASQGATAAPEKVLTLRTQGDHDTLWLVSSEDTATAAGSLPGVAEKAAVSPDGSTAAYLPMEGKPYVWIGYPAAKTISLASAGIKTVSDFAWMSDDQLLVSASKKVRDSYGYDDRLYTVNVTSGAVAPFRNLAGTEPDVSPDTGKVVYVQYKKLVPVSKRHPRPKYRESLMLTTVSGSGAGTMLLSEEYWVDTDFRAFAAPQIAPGGQWIAYAQTGSDVSANYSVCYLDQDAALWPWFSMAQGVPVAIAWAPASPLIALGGEAVGPESDIALYVGDAAAGATARTPRTLFTQASAGWVLDVAWSAGGKLVVDTMDKADPQASELRVFVLDSGDLSKLTSMGAGHLSVWVR